MSEREITCQNCGWGVKLGISVFYNPARNTLPEDDPFHLHNPVCPFCGEHMRGDVPTKVPTQEFLDVIMDDYTYEVVTP